MKESIARRAERKAERERQKQLKSEAWKKRKAENILLLFFQKVFEIRPITFSCPQNLVLFHFAAVHMVDRKSVV